MVKETLVAWLLVVNPHPVDIYFSLDNSAFSASIKWELTDPMKLSEDLEAEDAKAVRSGFEKLVPILKQRYSLSKYIRWHFSDDYPIGVRLPAVKWGKDGKWESIRTDDIYREGQWLEFVEWYYLQKADMDTANRRYRDTQYEELRDTFGIQAPMFGGSIFSVQDGQVIAEWVVGYYWSNEYGGRYQMPVYHKEILPPPPPVPIIHPHIELLPPKEEP